MVGLMRAIVVMICHIQDLVRIDSVPKHIYINEERGDEKLMEEKNRYDELFLKTALRHPPD